MARRIICLLAFICFLAPCCAHAQQDFDEFAWQEAHAPYYPAERPWIADFEHATRFPLTVRLRLDYSHYNGYNFVGGGDGHLFDEGADLNFSYRCGLTFASGQHTEFEARWIKPGTKLEIVLRKPGTNHIRTCRVATALLPAVRSTAYHP